ncbi:MAG TPA: amidohydrolase family protein [Candidatus Limnocylindrales bacterium]|nr:amidohydrolase family protein [Candidatus Limnocylindrales bacterium]
MQRLVLFCSITLTAACSGPRANIDSGLLEEIQAIRAVDNHAHPVRAVHAGEAPDRDFDALPVDNMEPQSDPTGLRADSPQLAEAQRALFGGKEHQRDIARQQGDNYPAWVLDKAGIETMVANRVTMGTSIAPPRFRWVPYADALMYPLDNSQLAAENPDRGAFFPLEDKVRSRFLAELGIQNLPATLADYTAQIVTPVLERARHGGAIAQKFEAAYLRSLRFEKVDEATASRIYAQYIGKPGPSPADYQPLQDYLFRYIARECGRLGMAVHIHTMAGAGGYFDVAGARPSNLEPIFNDPSLRRTNFVMIHGGWPYDREADAMLTKPNVYLDFSAQDLLLQPATLAGVLREWLEALPEKVMFGTDAYPYLPDAGWEEFVWIGSRNARLALAEALTGMVRDGEISRTRASAIARLVLRDNARKLYGL